MLHSQSEATTHTHTFRCIHVRFHADRFFFSLVRFVNDFCGNERLGDRIGSMSPATAIHSTLFCSHIKNSYYYYYYSWKRTPTVTHVAVVVADATLVDVLVDARVMFGVLRSTHDTTQHE